MPLLYAEPGPVGDITSIAGEHGPGESGFIVAEQDYVGVRL